MEHEWHRLTDHPHKHLFTSSHCADAENEIKTWPEMLGQAIYLIVLFFPMLLISTHSPLMQETHCMLSVCWIAQGVVRHAMDGGVCCEELGCPAYPKERLWAGLIKQLCVLEQCTIHNGPGWLVPNYLHLD